MFDRETGTRIGRRLYLGWEVGGWLGKADGFAAYVLGHGGSAPRRLHGRTVSIAKDLDGKRWSLENFARLLDPQLSLERFERVVLGINAPLGMPARFMRAFSSTIAQVPEPEYGIEKVMESRVAYRVTDRLVADRFEIKVASPCLDRLTNNSWKARAACAEFLRQEPRFAVPPFTRDNPATTRCVAIETNPETWWSKKWINFSSSSIQPDEWKDDDHVRDAATCAMNALWYDLSVSTLPATRFPLHPAPGPEDTPAPAIPAQCLVPENLAEYDPSATAEDREAIANEGWIYAPFKAEL